LEGEIKDLHSRIKQLEGKIEDLKALDNEELRKLDKTEEVQALEANMCNLEGQLEFEKGHWTELQGKYKDLLDRWEGTSVANVVRKKLDDHLDEEFHQWMLMEVTKRVTNIMKDVEL
jgi:predicted RNase H-like nuclease (RuvC/YqgF family)